MQGYLSKLKPDGSWPALITFYKILCSIEKEETEQQCLVKTYWKTL